MLGEVKVGLLNSPLINLLTGKPINLSQTIGTELVNPGGLSGNQSTGNTVYNALVNKQVNPIKQGSVTATTNAGWQGIIMQVFIGLIGLGIIIIGFVMIAKTDLKINIAKGVI